MTTITATNLIYKEELSAKAKAVYTYLAYRSNKENICFPALRRIAHDCSLSVSSVQRAMRELLECGLMKKKANYRENGSQTSNLYTIVSDCATKAAEREAYFEEKKAAMERKERALREVQMKMPVLDQESSSIPEVVMKEGKNDFCETLETDKVIGAVKPSDAESTKEGDRNRNSQDNLQSIETLSWKVKKYIYTISLNYFAVKGFILKKVLKNKDLTRGASQSDTPRTKTD